MLHSGDLPFMEIISLATRVGTKLSRIAPKLFKSSFSSFWLKSPRYVSFGTNLTQFGVAPDIAARDTEFYSIYACIIELGDSRPTTSSHALHLTLIQPLLHFSARSTQLEHDVID